MASGDTGFSHITVHADDDDEFVIQAGIRTPAPADPAPDPDIASFPDAESAPEEASPDQRESAPDQPDRPRPKKASEKEYRETTAEDLKPDPMSGMQKAIIAVALLCVAGFAAYYMFFMR